MEVSAENVRPASVPQAAWNDRATRPSPLLVLAIALVYFVAGKLGLRLAIVHPSATAIWPATGLALSAVLLFGYRVWPGIFLGAFVVNLTTAGSILTSVGIAAGNTLEAVLGAYLLTRFAGGRDVLDRAEGIFKFVFFACLVATTVSATVGTASIFLTGFLNGAHPKSVWFTWWLGDGVGALLVAPCFLLWLSRTHDFNRSTTPRRVVSVAGLLLSGLLVFSPSFLFGGFGFPLKFLCIPFVAWAAFELRRREMPLVLVTFSGIAVVSSVIANDNPITNQSLLVLQVFLGVAATTGLVISAAVSERNRHEQELREARAGLEARVQERTRELQTRIEEQKLTEQALQRLSARLLRVQDHERRRIARELHDSTGQSLAALTMALSQLAKGAAATDPKLSVRLDEASGVARSISDEVRTTSYLLHPPLLDETGLKSALAWYVQGFQEKSNLRATLELPGNLGRLTPDVEIMIFRIVQECLTNVLRHSKSKTVAVRLLLSESTEMLTLEVQDHGGGIAPDKLKAIAKGQTAGVGVRGMRERLSSVGGALEIFSDGNGTLVRSVVPLSPSADTLLEATSKGQHAST